MHVINEKETVSFEESGEFKTSLITGLVAELKQDQVNDDGKKEYSNTELDSADDKKKVRLGDNAIVDAKDGIVTTKAEIEALDDGIKAALETEAQPEAIGFRGV